MCGIVGQLAFGEQLVDEVLVRRMTETLVHRGPDDCGYYVTDKIGIGHRRLSIVDLYSGQQPLSSTASGLWLVANAEIYNHMELRQDLCADYPYKTQSDCEVILPLYQKYGAKCAEHLEGMFAFALWDEHEKTLLLSRDRFGIKPLYYYHDERCLLFGSELKALLQYPLLNKELNYAAIDQYFSLLAILEPNSIFSHVFKLPPGHFLLVRNGKIAHAPYARVEDVYQHSTDNDPHSMATLREKLEDSVRMSLRSDVPIGVFLSGGIDSSSIAVMAKKYLPELQTFSLGFCERDFDEGAYARKVAQHLRTKHSEVRLEMDTATDVAHMLTQVMDEPFADSSSIPVYWLSKHARESVKTVLSGEGGDELFAGYSWHQFWERSLDAGPLTLSQKVLFADARVIYSPEMRQRLYGPRLQCAYDLARDLSSTLLEPQVMNSLSGLNCSLYCDLKTYLPSDLLFKVDRASMLNALEVRVPFLNPQFFSYAARFPEVCKLRNGERKYVLKQMMADELPQEILARGKKGFSIPIDLWLWQKGSFRDMVGDVLFSQQLREREYFSPSFLETLWQGHSKLRRGEGYRLWTVFVFEMWCRRFLG